LVPMSLVNGGEYRQKKVSKAKGYNKQAVFRNQEQVTEELVADKIFKAVLIIINTFNIQKEQKVCEALLESFANIVITEHKFLTHEKLDGYLIQRIQKIFKDGSTDLPATEDLIFNSDVKSCDFSFSGAIIAAYDDYSFVEI
jgi:hypothetical protein